MSTYRFVKDWLLLTYYRPLGNMMCLIKLIFSNWIHINSTVWLHYLNFNEILGEKARWKIHKDVTWCFDQTQAAAPYKTVYVWPLSSYLTNYLSSPNIYWALRGIYIYIYIYIYIHIYIYRLCKYIYVIACTYVEVGISFDGIKFHIWIQIYIWRIRRKNC